MKNIFLLLLLCVTQLAFSQEERKHIREGNKYYQEEKYDKANESYKKALEKNAASEKASFNFGDALYKQQKYAESAQQFQQLAEKTSDQKLKANSYHNLGNSLLQAQKIEESITAYKKALRINPKDDETRYNLAYAQKKLKEQQEQENKDKDKEEEKKDENKDKENQDKKEGDQKEQQPKPNQLSKEDAQRMLDALNNKEKEVQAKLKKEKENIEKIKIEKDW